MDRDLSSSDILEEANFSFNTTILLGYDGTRTENTSDWSTYRQTFWGRADLFRSDVELPAGTLISSWLRSRPSQFYPDLIMTMAHYGNVSDTWGSTADWFGNTGREPVSFW